MWKGPDRAFSRLLSLALVALVSACQSSPGTIAGARPDTGFVRSEERHYVFSRERGWLIAGLDGRVQRRLFGPEYSIQDISDDGRVFVLTNSNTDLFVATGGGRRIREVGFFHGRLGAAAVTADGRRVAATRHADFSRPQKEWVEDETVYVVDTAALKVRKAARYRSNNGRGAAAIDWLNGRVLRVAVLGSDLQIVGTDGPEIRHVPHSADPLTRSPRRRREPACGAVLIPRGPNGDDGIDLVRKGRPPKRLVVILGRARGFHEYAPTVSDFGFSRDCRYAMFNFEHRVWVVEIATGRVGPLMAGANWIYRTWHPAGLE